MAPGKEYGVMWDYSLKLPASSMKLLRSPASAYIRVTFILIFIHVFKYNCFFGRNVGGFSHLLVCSHICENYPL